MYDSKLRVYQSLPLPRRVMFQDLCTTVIYTPQSWVFRGRISADFTLYLSATLLWTLFYNRACSAPVVATEPTDS